MTTSELRAAVEDLLRQATEEHSHYYTAEVLRAVLEFIAHAALADTEETPGPPVCTQATGPGHVYRSRCIYCGKEEDT